MNTSLKRLRWSLVVSSVAWLLVVMILQMVGFRFNTSGSIPIGWYRISQEPIHRGAYVLVCPPDTPVFQQARARGYLGAGFCPGHYGYLMKQIAALPGDTVVSNEMGMYINGHYYPHSQPLIHDGQGRYLPRFTTAFHRLQASELLLMTNQSTTSFDARYFGLLSPKQVIAVIQPVITWSAPIIDKT